MCNRRIPTPTVSLSRDEMEYLQKCGIDSSIKISKYERIKAKCVHRDENGETLKENKKEGTVTCSICNSSFEMKNYSDEEIEKIIKDVIGLCERIKIMYLTIPTEHVNFLAKLIPNIEKLKNLYKIAENNYNDIISLSSPNLSNAFTDYNKMMGANPFNPSAFAHAGSKINLY